MKYCFNTFEKFHEHVLGNIRMHLFGIKDEHYYILTANIIV